MKRFLVLPLLTLGLLAWGSAASADHGDLAKPACADIVESDTGYGFDRVVTSAITTFAPTCKGITYSVFIEVDPGEVVVVSSKGTGAGTETGRGLIRLTSAAITGDDDDFICVYVTSSRGGPQGMNTLLDRYPDSGCTTIALGGSGGGIGHG